MKVNLVDDMENGIMNRSAGYRAGKLLKPEERKRVLSDISKEETNALLMKLVKRGYNSEIK
ncbi:hypothetical protein [Bacillus sp. JJ722]|uniref:hypothetical protein n=1 Tax=Bacillus sp. JJ722 TaxID=3122973 RepID=UPI002FFE61BA